MMEDIVSHVVERLSNPEVLFGLAVRFFGVFLVLIIVMIVLYTTGWLFQRFTHEEEEPAAPARPGGRAPKPPVKATPAQPAAPAPTETAIPDEVAVAIALSLVPDEVAVAVAMALTEAVQERDSLPISPARGAEPGGWQQPESAWKLLGRQQALFRKTSLTRDITPKGE